MKELTKEQKEEFRRLKSDLSDDKEHVSNMITEFNDTMREAWRKVKDAQEELNTTVQSCNEFREGILEDFSTYTEELGEGHPELEKLAGFLDSWGEELSESEVTEPDEMEELEFDTDCFDDLPGVK